MFVMAALAAFGVLDIATAEMKLGGNRYRVTELIAHTYDAGRIGDGTLGSRDADVLGVN